MAIKNTSLELSKENAELVGVAVEERIQYLAKVVADLLKKKLGSAALHVKQSIDALQAVKVQIDPPKAKAGATKKDKTTEAADPAVAEAAAEGADKEILNAERTEEETYAMAEEHVRKSGDTSVLNLKRKFGISFAHAARLMGQLEAKGVVSEIKNGALREVLDVGNTEDDLNEKEGGSVFDQQKEVEHVA